MSKLVAVYGSLKQGFGNHRLLEGSKLLGHTETRPEWTMYNLGAFPALMKGGNTQIFIEVYEVSDETFEDLDCLEGYPKFYTREVIDTKYGDAWIYFIDGCSRTSMSPIVEHGVW